MYKHYHYYNIVNDDVMYFITFIDKILHIILIFSKLYLRTC